MAFKFCDKNGIRTHASEDTAALTRRLRTLGHPANNQRQVLQMYLVCVVHFVAEYKLRYLQDGSIELMT